MLSHFYRIHSHLLSYYFYSRCRNIFWTDAAAPFRSSCFQIQSGSHSNLLTKFSWRIEFEFDSVNVLNTIVFSWWRSQFDFKTVLEQHSTTQTFPMKLWLRATSKLIRTVIIHFTTTLAFLIYFNLLNSWFSTNVKFGSVPTVDTTDSFNLSKNLSTAQKVFMKNSIRFNLIRSQILANQPWDSNRFYKT